MSYHYDKRTSSLMHYDGLDDAEDTNIAPDAIKPRKVPFLRRVMRLWQKITRR